VFFGVLLFGYPQILPHYNPDMVSECDHRPVSAERFNSAYTLARNSEDIAIRAYQIREAGKDEEADKLAEDGATLLLQRYEFPSSPFC
jgi:hypothetical protein